MSVRICPRFGENGNFLVNCPVFYPETEEKEIKKHEINKTKKILPHDITWTFIAHVETNIESGIRDRTIRCELQRHWFTSEKEELPRRVGSSKFIQKLTPHSCNQMENI